MSYVHVSRRGAALWARLDRPERAGALGPEVITGLTEWLAEGADDPGIRALVVTGTGRAFCPGADVRASAAMPDTASRLTFLDRGRRLMATIETSPVPVVAAVNGAAFAGGFELLLSRDLVMASQGAVLGDLHLPHGRIPAWGGSARLVRAVGPARASRILLLGERFTAAQMMEFGLVSRVVPGPGAGGRSGSGDRGAGRVRLDRPAGDDRADPHGRRAAPRRGPGDRMGVLPAALHEP